MASVRPLNGASEGWEAARINVLRSLDEVSFVPVPVGCLTAFYEFDDVLLLTYLYPYFLFHCSG
jgi:hypothetical protein